jgi:hypothetical protein
MVAIPIDPVRSSRTAWYAHPWILQWRAFIASTAMVWCTAAIIASYIFVVFSPHPLYILSLGVYSGLMLFHVLFHTVTVRPWGRVFNVLNGASIPLAVVSLIESAYGRVVKTRLSDYAGRYAFLPSPGTYRLVLHARGYTFPVHEVPASVPAHTMYQGEDFTLDSSRAIVNADVPMAPLVKLARSKKVVPDHS